MNNLLFIDACIRDKESRTKKIAEPLINKLKKKYIVDTLVLNDLNLSVIQKDLFDERMNKGISPEVLSWAHKVKNAHRIVIAAPFWDMSFPAALKAFFELISLDGITFKSGETRCYGNCICDKMLFITTRGMNIKTGDELEQATPYLKALSWLWGIKSLQVIAIENLDYLSNEEIERKIQDAINEGEKIITDF